MTKSACNGGALKCPAAGGLETNDRRPEADTMKIDKKTIIAAATAIFAVAASLGSTLLTPEQREAVLQILAVVL